ncbi:MAG TPA: sterol desaturase family protein [Flavisolibacter sp.]|nr:sterol desaturase family protein [Flavisolibacter sp.]
MWSNYFDYAQQIGGRYFLVAGLFFLLFYVLLHKRVLHKKIQNRQPAREDYLREIGYSLITITIFAFVPVFMLHVPAIVKTTTYYTDINEYGWLYFFAAYPIMFFIHDTYFYWVHRLMHHKKLFRTFHLVHHKSTNPSPWAAYSFHPLEAIVEAGIFVVFLYTIPVHVLHILLFFCMMIVYNVYGHLGYELYPNGFSKHWFGRWINTSVNHNQHHQYFKGNYGLYFTFWDRMMGTIRSDYDTKFEDVTARKKQHD